MTCERERYTDAKSAGRIIAVIWLDTRPSRADILESWRRAGAIIDAATADETMPLDLRSWRITLNQEFRRELEGWLADERL